MNSFNSRIQRRGKTKKGKTRNRDAHKSKENSRQ